jgi:uncharacterized protein (DUF433 family)
MSGKRDDVRLRDAEVLTITEAAYAAELPRRTVERTVDRGEVKPLPRGKARQLKWQTAIYLRMRDSAGDLLTAKARRRLYDALCSGEPPAEVQIGPLTVSTAEAMKRVRGRVREIQRARRAVAMDPAIRAGEPVVRGTRIPVHMLVDLVKAGELRETILEDYPALTAQRLEDVLRWAALHPRVGRPRRSPAWEASPARHTFGPDELGAGD